MGKKWLLTLKSCVSYAADHTEMRSSGRMCKKWLLPLKSCVSYAADYVEVRTSDRMGKKWLLTLKHLLFVCGRSYRNEIERQDG